MGRCTFCATARSVQAAADDGDDGDDDDGAATGEAVHASPLLIIKRSWRADERASEGALLELATSRGAVGCARHVAHEDLTDIATLRNGLGTMGRPVDFARGRLLDMVPITVANRIYSSIVMTPVGTPITSCSTSSGSPPAHLRLLHALLGGLIGHASLFFTCRLLHRDISASNVMYCATPITLPPETTPATETQRRYAPAGLRHLNGFLIDLDFAVEYPPTAASGAPHKTGTLPFISIGVLDAEEHAYGHDLESFLYVLLWVCLGSDQGHGPLGELWQAGTLESIALIKSGFVTRTNHFENRLGNDFMPQFGAGRPLPTPLKELARAWRKVLFAIEGSGGDGAPGSASEEVYHVPSRSRTRGYIKPGLSEWDAFIRMRDSLWDAIQTLSAPEENSD
ncbi:hypothetical protein DFH27DRAFT_583507 [Peziza echinospora]|nr:hypothetical protein DFH27DRAFT_583507 [Peziza echinospora]